MIKKIATTLIALTIFATGLLALSGASSTSSHFVKTWGGKYNDVFNSVKQTSDGGYIAAGGSLVYNGDPEGLEKRDYHDAALVKFDEAGQKEWARYFGGSAPDEFKSVRQTADGGYIAAGLSNSDDGVLKGQNKGCCDAVLAKFDSSGHLKWVNDFGGGDDDQFKCVRQTADGGYIAVGFSNSRDGDLKGLDKTYTDAVLVKFDADGNLTWVKSFGGSKYDEFESVRQTADGGYIAAGDSTSKDGDLNGKNKGQRDAILVKYDADGNTKWAKTVGGSGSDKFFAVQQTSDGYIAAGRSSSIDGDLRGKAKNSNDALLAKFDANGDIKWVKTIGGSGYDNFYAVQQTSGGYIAAGMSNSNDGDLKGTAKGAADAILARFDTNGNLKWVRNTGGSEYDWFYSMQQTTDGGYIAVGASSSKDGDMADTKSSYEDAILVKFLENPPITPAPAVASSAESSHNVTGVTVTPYHTRDTFVKPGDVLQLHATVTGKDNPSQKVTWSVELNKSANTKISASGVLTVGKDETPKVIGITATSVEDPTVSGFTNIYITRTSSKQYD